VVVEVEVVAVVDGAPVLGAAGAVVDGTCSLMRREGKCKQKDKTA
jgi:hypothetical protein